MQAKEYALMCLARSDCHSAVLAEKIRRKGFSGEIAGEIAREFLEKGYLDDEAWLTRFIEKKKGQGYGPKMIFFELKKKGIEAELPFFDQKEAIAQFLERKFKGRLPEKQKLAALLLRRGFDYSEILSVLS